MGGNAFTSVLPDAVFPRMRPAVYFALKERIQARLSTLFAHVAVPREAPGKADYGDLDFVVAEPVEEVTLDMIKDALAAEHSIGGDTANFAVAMPESSPSERAYVQIDVHKCATVAEFDRVVFFHGYGDLGMMLGLLARSYGLSLGQNGLKIVVGSADDGEPPSFFLSADFPHILHFFGLDLARWEAGFASQTDVFEWVRSGRFFHPMCLRESYRRAHTRRDRVMYQNFLLYVRDLDAGDAYAGIVPATPHNVVELAKREFGKKEEYDALVRENRRRAHLKAVFNGHLVMEWTGLFGLSVREVMSAFRARVNDDELMDMSVEQVEAVVKQIHAERTAAPTTSSESVPIPT